MTKESVGVKLGREIRRRREALDMSLYILAERSGLTPNFIGTVEVGKRDPSLSTILALAKGLGISPSEFFPSVENLTAAAEEAGRLFDQAPTDIQRAVMTILRSMVKAQRK